MDLPAYIWFVLSILQIWHIYEKHDEHPMIGAGAARGGASGAEAWAKLDVDIVF